MEEDPIKEYFDNPKQDEELTPKDFIINPAARPTRRTCIYVSRDDKDTDIGKN